MRLCVVEKLIVWHHAILYDSHMKIHRDQRRSYKKTPFSVIIYSDENAAYAICLENEVLPNVNLRVPDHRGRNQEENDTPCTFFFVFCLCQLLSPINFHMKVLQRSSIYILNSILLEIFISIPVKTGAMHCSIPTFFHSLKHFESNWFPLPRPGSIWIISDSKFNDVSILEGFWIQWSLLNGTPKSHVFSIADSPMKNGDMNKFLTNP